MELLRRINKKFNLNLILLMQILLKVHFWVINGKIYRYKNNKLISYKTLENPLENGEIKDIKEKISLPNEDNLNVKIFTWDSLEKKNSKNDPLENKVKN